MLLTRCAFAVMLKFSNLLQTVSNIIEQLDMDKMTEVIPDEEGPEQDLAKINSIDSVENSDDVVKMWANAT